MPRPIAIAVYWSFVVILDLFIATLFFGWAWNIIYDSSMTQGETIASCGAIGGFGVLVLLLVTFGASVISDEWS